MYSFLWPFTYLIKLFFPEPKHNKDLNDIIYFDFETTGLNPYKDKIIEYSFILENNEDYDPNDKESFKDNTYISSLVNPRCKFEKKISEITGIHPDMLMKEVPIKKHMLYINGFINYEKKNRNIYLIAHNCDSFDKLFLLDNFKHYNKYHEKKLEFKHLKFIDTINLCKKLIPKSRHYSMKSMTEYFGLEPGTHRSMSDTIALRNLYHKLLEKMAIQTGYSKDFLLYRPDIVYDYIY